MPTSRHSPLIIVLLFLLFLPAVTTRINASDEIEYFSWLRSWAFDGDVDFENEYQYFYDTGAARNSNFHETFLERTTEIGRRLNFAPIGSAVLWAPFYAIGHAVARATGAPADGFSAPYVAAVAYGSALYGLFALLLTWSVSQRLVGDSLLSTVTVWLGTPLVFYMYVAPGFSHACSAFAVSAFLWIWLRVRDRWTMAGAVALGVSAAVMTMVREQDLFFVAGPALDFMRHAVTGARAPRRSTIAEVSRTLVAGAAAFALTYLPQLVAYRALNGHFGPTEAVGRKMSWTSPHFLEALISPQHGFFLWTPLALVSVLGLVWLAVSRERFTREAHWIGRLALVMFVLQIYITGCVESWTVAGAFGQRRFVATTPLLALGLAAIFTTTGYSMLASAGRAAIVTLAIWWNVGLMVQFGLHIMNRQALSPSENARMTFLELPRNAPVVVWRYLTDRSSFFGVPPQRPAVE